MAQSALRGVGDAALGEWENIVGRGFPASVHLRRRLSAKEVAASGLFMRDVRGTAEATNRAMALLEAAPSMGAFVDQLCTRRLTAN
jgi:hypothetical protein